MRHENAIELWNTLCVRCISDDNEELTPFGLIVMSHNLPTVLCRKWGEGRGDGEKHHFPERIKDREAVADWLRSIGVGLNRSRGDVAWSRWKALCGLQEGGSVFREVIVSHGLSHLIGDEAKKAEWLKAWADAIDEKLGEEMGDPPV